MTHHERLKRWADTCPNNSWTLPVTKQDALDLVRECGDVQAQHTEWLAWHQKEIDDAHRTLGSMTHRVEALETELDKLQREITWCHRAIQFYAKHEHWMAVSSDTGQPCKLLIANDSTQDSYNGWSVAEVALRNLTQQALMK
jgi:hypothetical protein